MTIPGYNGLIVAHTLRQTEYNLINSNSHSSHKNTQFDSGDHLIINTHTHTEACKFLPIKNTKYMLI